MRKKHTFLDHAIQLLDEAGQLSRRYFRMPLDITLKEGLYPVTQADTDIEMLIRSALATHYPFHDILGEEYGLTDLFSAYLWVIDPIDGTAAFAAGKPTFTSLIALYKDTKPLFGIIDQPILNERWVGISGEKTQFNGEICQANIATDLSSARLSCTTPEMFDQHDWRIFQSVRKQVASVSYGGDAYAYGLLARGYIDVILEADLKFYDVAALIPILEGAGAVITDWSGNTITPDFDGSCLAAANPQLHTKVLELVCG
ncbi:MAG: histidinol phosphate phosphatase [Gammaproteobacteria bacterium]|nr:histidinol phosphate phosphatase [Gammaproteobacteria bacterium]